VFWSFLRTTCAFCMYNEGGPDFVVVVVVDGGIDMRFIFVNGISFDSFDIFYKVVGAGHGHKYVAPPKMGQGIFLERIFLYETGV